MAEIKTRIDFAAVMLMMLSFKFCQVGKQFNCREKKNNFYSSSPRIWTHCHIFLLFLFGVVFAYLNKKGISSCVRNEVAKLEFGSGGCTSLGKF